MKFAFAVVFTVAMATAQTPMTATAPTTREGCLAAMAAEKKALVGTQEGWTKAREAREVACMPPPASATTTPAAATTQVVQVVREDAKPLVVEKEKPTTKAKVKIHYWIHLDFGGEANATEKKK